MSPIVYRMPPKSRRPLVLTGAAIAAVPLLLGVYGIAAGEGPMVGAAGIVTLVMLPFIGYLVWCATRARLAIDANGMVLTGVLGRTPVRVGWSEIQAIHLGPGRAGLVLAAPQSSHAAEGLAEFANVRIGGAPFYAEDEARWIAERRWVPFDAFAGWIDDGGLRADLERFAPRLVAGIDADRTAVEAARRAERRAITMVFASMGLLVAVIVAWTLYGPALSPAMEATLQRGFAWIEPAFFALIAVALFASGLANLVAAWRRLRAHRFGYALLWLALGTVQILAVMAVAGHVLS